MQASGASPIPGSIEEWRGFCLLQRDGAFQRQDINGREYIIVLRPVCG